MEIDFGKYLLIKRNWQWNSVKNALKTYLSPLWQPNITAHSSQKNYEILIMKSKWKSLTNQHADVILCSHYMCTLSQWYQVSLLESLSDWYLIQRMNQCIPTFSKTVECPLLVINKKCGWRHFHSDFTLEIYKDIVVDAIELWPSSKKGCHFLSPQRK